MPWPLSADGRLIACGEYTRLAAAAPAGNSATDTRARMVLAAPHGAAHGGRRQRRAGGRCHRAAPRRAGRPLPRLQRHAHRAAQPPAAGRPAAPGDTGWRNVGEVATLLVHLDDFRQVNDTLRRARQRRAARGGPAPHRLRKSDTLAPSTTSSRWSPATSRTRPTAASVAEKLLQALRAEFRIRRPAPEARGQCRDIAVPLRWRRCWETRAKRQWAAAEMVLVFSEDEARALAYRMRIAIALVALLVTSACVLALSRGLQHVVDRGFGSGDRGSSTMRWRQ